MHRMRAAYFLISTCSRLNKSVRLTLRSVALHRRPGHAVLGDQDGRLCRRSVGLLDCFGLWRRAPRPDQLAPRSLSGKDLEHAGATARDSA